VTPPPEIAERLGLKAGEKALIRRRQMYAGGQPMQLATSYIPWSFAEGPQMVERDSGPGGIYSRLADVGHAPVRFTEEVATRMPTPEEARFLRLTDPQPVFNQFRTAFDGSGALVRSASMSCRVIAGCSPMSGRPTSAASGNSVRWSQSVTLCVVRCP
jgi:GntR family transcriptional regulator